MIGKDYDDDDNIGKDGKGRFIFYVLFSFYINGIWNTSLLFVIRSEKCHSCVYSVHAWKWNK